MLMNLLGSLAAAIAGLGLAPYGNRKEEVPAPGTAPFDLERCMGRWYPIAAIAPWTERDDFDPMIHYHLDGQGVVRWLRLAHAGAIDGPHRLTRSWGAVRPRSGGAVWDVHSIGPLRKEYRILWLASDYSQLILAAPRRGCLWFLARTPLVTAPDYQAAAERICSMGYDASRLRKIPRKLAVRYSSR
jgi:apolipoprotein D and lipocalin family protein